MIKRSLITAACALMSALFLLAQDQVKIPNGISIAIKAGNAAELSKFINSTVELRVLDKEDFYKKNVAETILKDFFEVYKTRDFVIILDEKGKELNTKELSEQLARIFMLPKKRVVFIIGGPWGFSEEVYSRADMKLSLSKLTFSHQLVRLLFAEQLYRVLTVIKGDPYHHG